MIRFVLLLNSLLIASASFAQFRYVPDKPQPGEVVSFTYTPTGALAKQTDLQGVYVRYGSPLVMRLSQPETATAVREGNALVGTVKLPKRDVAGVLMAFQSKANPTLADHNGTHFYPILLYSDAGESSPGTVLPHATGGQASVMMRTGFPYAMKVKPDWTWAIAQYEREIKQNPDTRPLYWSDLILAKMREQKPNYRQTALADVDTYLKSHTPTPAELNTAAGIYEQLGEQKLALAARERIKVVDPTGDPAQKAKADLIRAETDMGKKLTAYSSFTQSFPNSTYRGALVSSVAEAYFKPGQFKELVTFLEAQPAQATDPVLLLSFAQQMADEGRGLPQAEWIANRAVAVFKQRLAPKNSGQDRPAQIRAAQAVLAQAIEGQGRANVALTVYRQALANVPPEETDPRLNERTWACAQRAAKADSALPFIESAVREGRATMRLRANLRDWQATRLGSPAKGAAYLRDLEADYRADRRAELAERFVNQPAPNFALSTLDGNTVSLASMRGKVVVLDFWATWCGPCVASFPAMRQARDYFKNDPKVQFLFVNTREGGPLSRVQHFVGREPYIGVIPLDQNQKVSDAYGVEGIPTKVIIDPKGRVRYRSIGYSGNAEATADELTLIIEALKEM